MTAGLFGQFGRSGIHSFRAHHAGMNDIDPDPCCPTSVARHFE